jgi:hypothetical protein
MKRNSLNSKPANGAMDEYTIIEQTIDPLVLEEIYGWVLKQTK